MKSKGLLFFRIAAAFYCSSRCSHKKRTGAWFGDYHLWPAGDFLLLICLPKIHLPKIPKRKLKEKQRKTAQPSDDVWLCYASSATGLRTSCIRMPGCDLGLGKRPSTERLLSGKAVRLCVAWEFTHAEVCIDAYGSLRLKMMRIEPFTGRQRCRE